MRLFLFQVKNDEDFEDFDDIRITPDFEDICSDYNVVLTYYRNKGELRAIEEPTLDEETNEVHGMFVVIVNGKKVSARIRDYYVEEY